MKAGVWFDLRNPPGWRQDPARLYGFTLELCEEAERQGADSVWFSEHHGFEDGYLPQPLTFAAAAAARTTRVRLGTGILIAPLRKTAQLAEEAAVVDIISGGRLDLGLGAGYRIPEFELFDTDYATRYRVLDSQVKELRRLWGEGSITPAPVQDRLPVWLGYQGPKGARRAGRMGERLLTLAKASWPYYREGLAEGGHDPACARMSGGVQAYVTEDPERDWPRVAPHIAYQQDSYRRHMVVGTGNPVPRPVNPERLRTRGPDAGPLSYYLFGTPEEVAEAILEYAGDAPVDTVWLCASVAGLPEDLTARHVQTICSRLVPLLASSPTATQPIGGAADGEAADGLAPVPGAAACGRR
ncbi:MAG: LLM class flavin-dependent oxidoreductase [Streptosporangiaceae bacterium]|nr:LLM class flavin-dependent oxidoreductase [Streptosporangiaceae bacterium]MBV9855437.1 LLM class flavin-dependent oxidoreductase [Streptosporangiaceae bacterium]